MLYNFIVFVVLSLPIVSVSKIFFSMDAFSLIFDVIFIFALFVLIFTRKINNNSSAFFWFFCLTFVFSFSFFIKNEIPNMYDKIAAFRLSAIFTYAFFIPFFLKRVEYYKLIMHLPKIIMIVGLVVSVNGIRQWVYPFSSELAFADLAGGAAKFYGDAYQGSQNAFRIYSFFITSVHLVVFLSFAFYVALSRALYRIGDTFFNYTSLILTFICIILTYSRTGYLAFFVGLFFFFPVFMKTSGVKSISTIILVLVGFSLLGYIFYSSNSLFQSRLTALSNVQEVSAFDSRLMVWSSRWTDILSNPLGFGVGSAGWNVQEAMGLGVDSNYLKPIVELGWIGGGFYLLFIFSITFKSIFNYIKHIHFSAEYTFISKDIMFLVYPSFVFCCLVHMVTNQILEAYPINLLFWLISGFMWFESGISKKPRLKVHNKAECIYK